MSENTENVVSANVETPPNTEIQIIDIPPKPIQRNEYGLIKGINYLFKENCVDWRAMVSKEFLYINPELKDKVEKKYNKKIDEIDIISDQVDDRYLVILLNGLKTLAQLRGFSSVTFRPVVATASHCVTVCKITWIPNYETEGREIVFESVAGASLDNTNGFGQKYLPELAENRSFCRAVRNFLKIQIVSKEELGNEKEPSNNHDAIGPVAVLKDLLEEKNISFDTVKEKRINEGYEEAKNWTDINNIPIKEVEELIKRLRKVKSAKKDNGS